MSLVSKGSNRWLTIGALGLIAALAWVGANPAAAGEVSKKMKRQIDIMEEIISDVLVDSPYLLVSSGGPTHGVYAEGFGVIFGLETSLVSSSRSGLRGVFGGLKFLSRGDHRIIWEDDDDEYWDDDDDADDDDSYKKWRERRKTRDSRYYERGKQELRETLLEYGDSLTELDDDDWVAIAMYLEDHRYFRRNDISRVFLKIKARDLRAHAAGNISYEELEKRLIEEVY